MGRAIEIGRGRVARTLSATFKLIPEGKGISQGIRTPKGFRRKGLLFIEKRGQRLSTRGETSEIQTARLRI